MIRSACTCRWYWINRFNSAQVGLCYKGKDIQPKCTCTESVCLMIRIVVFTEHCCVCYI